MLKNYAVPYAKKSSQRMIFKIEHIFHFYIKDVDRIVLGSLIPAGF